MTYDFLNKYKTKGHFTSKPYESFTEKCKAPNDKARV